MFKKNTERTPQERAQRAKFSVLARLGACAYLIYIMYQLLFPPQGTEPPSQIMTIIIVVMIVLSAVVILMTLNELYRGLKAGRYNAATYEDESVLPQATQETADNGEDSANQDDGAPSEKSEDADESGTNSDKNEED